MKPLNQSVTTSQQTAQTLIGIRDIRDRFLYTTDGWVLTYLRVTPISIDLLSEREKQQKTRQLTAEFAAEQKPFQFLAAFRPIDISPLVSECTFMIANTDNQKRRELLRMEMMHMSEAAMSGDVVERQFFFLLWQQQGLDCEFELAKRAQEIQRHLGACSIISEPLEQKGIIQLCNLINNPAYAHMEDSNVRTDVAIIEGLWAD